MNKIHELIDELPAKVGKYYKSIGREVVYGDVEYDSHKWADSSKFLPRDYDLCYCKMEKQTLAGWYTGVSWDGLNVKPDDEVFSWKLNYDN